MEQDEQDFQVTTQPSTTPSAPISMLGMLTPDMIDRAERMVEGIKRIKSIALKVTNRLDWQRFGNTGYLSASGCQKVAALFGVNLEFTRETERLAEDREGKQVIVYKAYCRATFNGRTFDAVGIVDSEKLFYIGKEDPKPLEERDFASMEKHATTNAMNRALKAVIGFNGITWEEVEASLGSEAGKATNISFKTKPAAKQVDTVDGAKAKSEMKRMLLEMGQGDVVAAKDILRELTTTTNVNPQSGKPWPPKESVDGLTDKAAVTILKQLVTPAYAKWKQSTGGDPFSGEVVERQPGEEG